MPAATRRPRAANLALLLVLPAPFLEGVSLTPACCQIARSTRRSMSSGATRTCGPVSVVFTAATLLGTVLAIALRLFAVLRLEWRPEPGAYSGVLGHWASNWCAGRGRDLSWRSSLAHPLQEPL